MLTLKEAAANLREILKRSASRERYLPRAEELIQLFSRANYAGDAYISATIRQARADVSEWAANGPGDADQTSLRNARASITELERLIGPDGDSLQSP